MGGHGWFSTQMGGLGHNQVISGNPASSSLARSKSLLLTLQKKKASNVEGVCRIYVGSSSIVFARSIFEISSV